MLTYEDIQNDLIVTINDNVLNELKRVSLESYPNETGGFLVGKYLSNTQALVECLVHPTGKKCGPCSFERSTKGMKDIWDNLYDSGLIYLGEWHTHPNGSCNYSNTDLEAMRSIVSSEYVHIAHPLLLIASPNKYKIQNINVYYCDSNQLVKLICKNGTCRA